MKADDRSQFQAAMQHEFDAHRNNKHWDIISRDQVPGAEVILDSVWAMKRKRNILTGEVYKHKTRLHKHGGQQKLAINFNIVLTGRLLVHMP